MSGYEFPSALAEIAGINFPYEDDDSIDFEPYPQFWTVEETASWWRAWTGNAELDGAPFCAFGQDGSGGIAAFWLIRDGVSVVDQPVVFLGSEGETGGVATDLAGFLWLLAQGIGPYELVAYGADTGKLLPEVEVIAERWAPGRRRPPAEIAAEVAEVDEALRAYVEGAVG